MEAKETWPGGCQSWVATTVRKRRASAAEGATTSSPPVTREGAAGQEVVLQVDEEERVGRCVEDHREAPVPTQPIVVQTPALG